MAGEVDSSVVRGKAAIHALLPAAAFLLGEEIAPYLLAFTGIAMAVSVLAGPKFSLFGRLFRLVIQPAFKIPPGRREDAAPHRFAEALGAVVLLAAAAAYAAGQVVAGAVLALMVAALAALNAIAAICIGCQMYLLFKRTSGKAA